jgi:hypothetical protein
MIGAFKIAKTVHGRRMVGVTANCDTRPVPT